MANQEPTVFNDRYELHRQIARGGMADVFLARDLLLDRPVAIKVLFDQFSKDQQFVERFRREAQRAANLNHPNIVSVFDWGEESGTYFIVMEYVEGRSLAEIIRTEGSIHPDKVADQISDAVLDSILKNDPKTYVTTTSTELKKQMEKLNLDLTPQKSLISGFNGLILGFAKKHDIQGIGMYGEINQPEVPQYRAAISIIKTIEKLTYRKLGNTEELEILAQEMDQKFRN